MTNFAFCFACLARSIKATSLVTRRLVAIASVAALLAFGGFGSSVHGQVTNPGDFVLDYTAATGNMTLVFTGTGTSGAGPVSLESLDIISLGNADSSNPLMPAGIPGVTAGQGGLNGATAVLPTAQFQTLNNSNLGINGIYSQIFNANVGSTWRSFDLTNPGVSDRLDLGNVAPTGWSLSNLSTIFMTDPNVYGDYNYGHFGYTLGGGNPVIGVVVPEPASAGMFAAIGMLGLGYRRRTAKSA